MEFWIRGRKNFLTDCRFDSFQKFRKIFIKHLDFLSCLLYIKLLKIFLKAFIRRQLEKMKFIGINGGVSPACVSQQVCCRKNKLKTMYVEGYQLSGASIQSGGKHEIKNKMESAVPGSVI
ncbi:MAG: hypothetical protein NT166_01900 [Candidatus Aminicenantes bacterium]|nr:hypothetical protein [Candidatus Aminicenantes bacterium]